MDAPPLPNGETSTAPRTGILGILHNGYVVSTRLLSFAPATATAPVVLLSLFLSHTYTQTHPTIQCLCGSIPGILLRASRQSLHAPFCYQRVGFNSAGGQWRHAIITHLPCYGPYHCPWNVTGHQQPIFCHSSRILSHSDVRCHGCEVTCRKAGIGAEYDYYRTTAGSSSEFFDWAIEGYLGTYATAGGSGGCGGHCHRLGDWVAV